MRRRHHRAAIGIGLAFLLASLLSYGCGNPEAPQITNVRLSYWDSPPGEEGAWVPLENGGIAAQSPVRVQGNISDNTAVVSPRIVWIGERADVDLQGFTECTEAENQFYECEMRCEETGPGFFECAPLLPASKLIRGDLFRLTLSTAEGEEHELQVQVSEAQDLQVPDSEGDPIQILEEYRILRVTSLTEEPNPFLWSLRKKTTTGGGFDTPLRSGDALALGAGDEVFQIGLEAPEGVEMDGPPTALWRSLVKWNDDSFLNWDATSGNFEEQFQLFDPRDRQGMTGDDDAPVFRFAVSAEDVPDQKTGVFRSSEVLREFIFSPEVVTQEPNLEVDGEEEELIEASSAAENVVGTVESFSGEVRTLGFSLAEGPGGTAGRFLHFNPDQITLAGGFTATIVFVSDWNGDEVVDAPVEDGGIPNTIGVVALDMQGNWKRTTLPVLFPPSTAENQVPELQVLEIFPRLDTNREAQLPIGEEVRVRARAADDRGAPVLAHYRCAYRAPGDPEDPEERCDYCNEAACPLPETPDWESLNAGGEYPRDPWEWIHIDPGDAADPDISKTIGVLVAREKVEDPEDLPTAEFSGIEIAFEPEADQEIFQIAVSLPETVGPNVILAGLKNGDIVDPDGLVVAATIFPNVSEINEIKALWNGEPPGEGDPKPTFNLTRDDVPELPRNAFSWDLTGKTVTEGDRVCVGAISVTGHAVLHLLEFVAVNEGLLLGLTVTTDPRACDPLP